MRRGKFFSFIDIMRLRHHPALTPAVDWCVNYRTRLESSCRAYRHHLPRMLPIEFLSHTMLKVAENELS